ncbi:MULTISPECIES: FAD-binding oxidoreductase [Kitasatospora]|uniref:nitric oxide dioxygenase n=1 Tax=Kitasatospora setae (strain ATCC 33774 / DSM 43861 / JCM 3304 / KCC A-0304 / NBRC 14216 / KM-6054) TaxID=452652 RepID=E4NEI4_KITSK|nr:MULTISPECIES: FAD-binding oxidoreductase [Kitasatospora]BAJ29770.1 putative oxidoreductase [Kitasatospora setae KM-6054]
MSTRQLVLQSRSSKAGAGRGTTPGPVAPGAELAPAPAPAGPAEPADEPPTAVERPEPSPAVPSVPPPGPLGLTPVPAVPAKPTWAPAVPSAVSVPPLPAFRPAAPAPVPVAQAASSAPAGFEPLFRRAPALNWVGPDDRWSRAWGVVQSAVEPPPVLEPADPVEPLPPSAEDLVLVRASLAAVAPEADRAMAHFHALMFLRHPELRAMFPAAMDEQRTRLFQALRLCAVRAGDPEALRDYLGPLGRRHRKYGALTRHYASVADCLVAALARYGGSGWDGRTEAACRRLLALASRLMVEGAEEEARTAPPWWQAEVVEHRQATRDVAVLTLRPDQAYPFRAGQWAAVETPWWPRVWRPYSFGSAPRPDGLLTLHVKAVQAGWVSNALVHRARPGDVLRLGAAEGAMTVDHAAGGDLLCLGGGTGIGPVAALVEEVAERGAAGRRVEVFYGARRADGLYRLEELRELAARNAWLTVRPVVSEPAGAPAGVLVGDLPEVVARYAPWHGFAAYLSGPAAMVRSGAAALRRCGVPDGSVRHDPVDR